MGSSSVRPAGACLLAALALSACRAESVARWDVTPASPPLGHAETVPLWERDGVRTSSHTGYEDDVGSIELEVENQRPDAIRISFSGGGESPGSMLSGTGYDRPLEGDSGERGAMQAFGDATPLRVGARRGSTVFLRPGPCFGSRSPADGAGARLHARVDGERRSFEVETELRVAKGAGVRWYLGR